MWETILSGIFAFVPALVANSLAVVFGGGPPMDLGREIGGKRILGDGKTWRGFIGGGASAGLIGLLLTLTPLSLYSSLLIPFALSYGSMTGDLLGSLVKRRGGWERGEKVPVLDQYDFVLGAFLISIICYPAWTLETYFSGHGYITLAMLLVAVPALHRGVNIIGYRMGLKKEPW